MSNDSWINNDDDIKYVIGSDEVGTGACAGCFVVCGVKAPISWNLDGLADSKRLSEKKRKEMERKILSEFKNKKINYSLIEIPAHQIDELGLAEALKYAHRCVINNLVGEYTVAIVDGKLNIDAKCPIKSMVKADTEIPTVMAAAILAKNYRDRKMKILHEKYPMYGWNQNVGYIVSAHKEAIRKHGLSPFHRKSYKLKDI